MKKEYFGYSIYITSNKEFTEEEAFKMLDQKESEQAEFIEFDYAVASHFNKKYCAIYHINEQAN